MKIKNNILFLVIALFVASCGPVTPAPSTAVATPLPEQEVLNTPVPIVWPEKTEEAWTNFSRDSYFRREVAYDPSGFLWTIKENNVYRWNLKTNKSTEYTVKDGLPENLMDVVFFDGKVRVMSGMGEIAYYLE